MQGKTLKFGAVTREADVRMLDEVRDLLLDREFARDASNRPLYYMYRDLYRERDEEAIRSHDLRFDITVIPPARLGREYVKTKGHYHPPAAKQVPFPEIYEVMQGNPTFLLQKDAPDRASAGFMDRVQGKQHEATLQDVVAVEAAAGDKVIIPPGYGHITINPAGKPVKLANWVSSRFDSLYGPIEANRGGAYYYTIADEWVRNPQYEDVPPLRTATPSEVPDLDITTQKSMYTLINKPDRLAFLNRPHKFQWVFENLY